MKTFEERYTAWVDDRLPECERADFERELESHPDAHADRQEVQKLSAILRQHGPAPVLTSGDFFNTQLLERIEREERQAEGGSRGVAKRPRFFFSWALPHLAWGGAFCLLLSFTLYREWVAPAKLGGGYVASRVPVEVPTGYETHVLDAKAMEPGISATTVQSKRDGVTVLWLDGMDYLPASYQLR